MTDVPWTILQGAYRLRPAIVRAATEGDWEELWQELHHQGDVDTASYAALPLIADIVATGRSTDWNPYALAATIEEARTNVGNPPLPVWGATAYAEALQKLFESGMAALADAQDELLTTSILAVVALHKRLPFLARFALLSERERGDALAEIGWA